MKHGKSVAVTTHAGVVLRGFGEECLKAGTREDPDAFKPRALKIAGLLRSWATELERWAS